MVEALICPDIQRRIGEVLKIRMRCFGQAYCKASNLLCIMRINI